MGFTSDAAVCGRPCRLLRSAVLIVLTASIAALLAHIGIDIAGDYVLPHDSYDDITHGSRMVVACSVLTILVGLALRLLLTALDTGRTRRPTTYATPVLFIPARFGLFLVLVVLATFIGLAGMECLDSVACGRPLDDIADLLGGSYALGVAIALPTALLIATFSWRIARWVRVAHRIVVSLVCAWFVAHDRRIDALQERYRRPSRCFALAPEHARSASKRGPPLSLR